MLGVDCTRVGEDYCSCIVQVVEPSHSSTTPTPGSGQLEIHIIGLQGYGAKFVTRLPRYCCIRQRRATRLFSRVIGTLTSRCSTRWNACDSLNMVIQRYCDMVASWQTCKPPEGTFAAHSGVTRPSRATGYLLFVCLYLQKDHLHFKWQFEAVSIQA